MKVLYLITKSNWGGAQKYVFDLALAARERGFEVVVAAGGEGELLTHLHNVNIRTIPLPTIKRDIQFLGEFSNLFKLIKLLKQERPDIIHLNSSKIGGLGALAGRWVGVPKIIFTIHGWAFNERRFIVSRLLIASGHWLTVLLAHQSIAVAGSLAKQINIFPGVKNKIVIIHNGIKPIYFLPKDEARRKLDPENKDTLWIGTIAELHQNKGLDILFLAIKRTLAKIGGLNVIIIGEGEERERLARLIAEHKLTNNVHLLGRVPEAAKYLKGFDLFVLPSRTEALPTVILEAGLAEVPVIASRVGGTPEIIDNEDSGLLITPGNYKDLSLAIEKLLINQDLAQTLGHNLKQKVLTAFSRDQMLDQTFALYQNRP